MTEAETVSETPDFKAIVTRLTARENLTAINHRESFKFYKMFRKISGPMEDEVSCSVTTENSSFIQIV
jgi:hypothetical protein